MSAMIEATRASVILVPRCLGIIIPSWFYCLTFSFYSTRRDLHWYARVLGSCCRVKREEGKRGTELTSRCGWFLFPIANHQPPPDADCLWRWTIVQNNSVAWKYRPRDIGRRREKRWYKGAGVIAVMIDTPNQTFVLNGNSNFVGLEKSQEGECPCLRPSWEECLCGEWRRCLMLGCFRVMEFTSSCQWRQAQWKFWKRSRRRRAMSLNEFGSDSWWMMMRLMGLYPT